MARQSAPGIPILVTRPKAEALAFAGALALRFGERVRPVVAPLLAPRNLTPDLPEGDFSAVVFTSAQAVEAARPLMGRLPGLAWCVGRRTARAATEAGFLARSADGNAETLLAALATDPPEGSILYLRGVDTAVNLLEKLHNSGLCACEAVVYIQDPLPLTPEATALLQVPKDVIVPLFSPRSGRLFREGLPDPTNARLHVAVMSDNVAAALGELSLASLVTASQPTGEAMLDTIETLLARLPLP